MSEDVWSIAEAKAHFSEVVDRATPGAPQFVTKHGKKRAVVMSFDEWQARHSPKGNLAEFLMASPLRGSGLKLRRWKSYPKPPKL